MPTAHVNRIATAVPPHDVHDAFVGFAREPLDARRRAVFDRLVERSQIAHRHTVLGLEEARAFYARGSYPTLAPRMRLFEKYAPELAERTVARLELGPDDVKRVTHVIVTSCTGLSAPGLDLELVARLGLRPSVERTMINFMGCYAAINALKVARHVVRSEPDARVLVVNLELCSLHLKETDDLEEMLSFVLFGDGCAASLVTAEPVGFALDRFHATIIPNTHALITWRLSDVAFDMVLSGQVPGAIAAGLDASAGTILAGEPASAIDLWAAHPGGRTILDAVQRGLGLPSPALAASREVLRRFGNMSSASVMFVLESMFAEARRGARGCAMSFGPGLTAETMFFRKV